MKSSSFLDKLKDEGMLKLVEPSEEISQAYIIKSDKCIQVAKLAFGAGIYENAVSEAYYSIYNTVTALFYKCGIKCENHSGAAILLKKLFGLTEFYNTFSEFKKDRIDNQYYIPIMNSEPISKELCSKRLMTAQRFNAELRAYMERLKLEDIKRIREKYPKLK